MELKIPQLGIINKILYSLILKKMFLHRIGFQTQKFNFLFILEFLSCLKAIPEVKQRLVHLNQLLFDFEVPLSKNLQSLRLFELSGTAV